MNIRIFFLAFCLMFILPSAVFAVAGSITGRVTNGNRGVSGVSVWTYSSDGSQVLGSSTDTNGYYIVSGLPSGSYKVYFHGAFVGYINQWFSNKSDFNSADLVMVTAPDQMSGIDAVLNAAGSIAGTVTDGTIPLPNIGVWIYDSSCGLIEKTSTNYNGQYAAGGLPSGNYKVLFDSGSTGYIDKWYNDKTSCVSADSVVVTAPNTTSSIDAALIRTGGLAGRVTDGTNGIALIIVGVYDSSCILKATAVTNLMGDYAVGGLPPGDYKVSFLGESAGFSSEWYSNQSSCAVADSVTVTDENTTKDIDAVLASLYRLLTVSASGTGSGTVTSNPPAINCGSTCSTSFVIGTQLDLSANAASGSFFSSWTGACAGNASPCTITIADNNNITACFNTYADFTADTAAERAPLFVSFTDLSSNNPTTWLWDFGDSGSSNLQNPVHKYASPGTYSVTLSNMGSSGSSSLTKKNYITVSPCENNPVRIDGFTITHTSIQDVYDTGAVSGDVIEVQALDLPETLLFDKDKTVTLRGGFDCPFATNTRQYTTVETITVGGILSGAGEVILENIIVR